MTLPNMVDPNAIRQMEPHEYNMRVWADEQAIEVIDRQKDRIRELEQHANDSRFLLAALIQKAGGRIELTMGEVIAIDANASIVTWDDVINGKKVYMLQTLTTSQSDAATEQLK